MKEPFENPQEKGQTPGDHHFLLFPQYYLSFHEQISIFIKIYCDVY